MMDGISLIVTALLAGITSGITQTASKALKDTYDALKGRLLQISTSPNLENTLTKLETDPTSESLKENLQMQLTTLNIIHDEVLLNLANLILDKVKSEYKNENKYRISIVDSNGVIVGDNAITNQNFSKKQKKKAKKRT